MSEKNAQIRTGVFVTAVTALLIVSILFFGGDRAFLKSYVFYKIKFKSTQGLVPGSVISVAGVEVGHIEQITFTAEHTLDTIISVEKTHMPLVNENSEASIRTQGALGDKYIYITAGTEGAKPLTPGDYIKAEDSGDIMEILSNKMSDLTALTETVKELNILLHNLNADGKSAHITENIIGATKGISNLTSDANIKATFATLKSVLNKIDAGEGTLGKLVNDASIYERLVNLLGDAPRNQYLKPLLREAIKQNEQKH